MGASYYGTRDDSGTAYEKLSLIEFILAKIKMINFSNLQTETSPRRFIKTQAKTTPQSPLNESAQLLKHKTRARSSIRRQKLRNSCLIETSFDKKRPVLTTQCSMTQI